MKKVLFPIIIFVLLILGSNKVLGQEYPIEVNLSLPYPYPSNLDAYFDYLDQGQIQIFNSSASPIDVFFKVRFSESQDLISIYGPETQNESITIAPGMNLLSSADIREVFSALTESDFHSKGLTDEQWTAIQVNKQLPEGEYSLCVYAYDALNTLISDPDGNGCAYFDILYGERPIIEVPLEGDTLPAFGNVNISWTQFLTNPKAIANTEYLLKMIDVTEQEIKNIPNAMLDPGISPDYEENIGNLGSAFIQDKVDLLLVPGHTYAIRVTAVDQQNEIAYQYGGHSEIVSFVYGRVDPEEEPEDSITKVFPSTPKLSTSAKCAKEFVAESPDDTASVVLQKVNKAGEYQFGKVKLAVSSIDKGDTTNGYEGEGYITLKLQSKDYRIAVIFKDLKVNKAKEVFAGEAFGRKDKLSEIDDKVADVLRGTTELSYEEASIVAAFPRLRTKLSAAEKGVAISLPVGIEREVKGDTMMVGINQMVFSPTQASLTALFSFQNESWGRYIPTLGAESVCFTSEGISSDAKLILAKDYVIPQIKDTLVLKKYESSAEGIESGTYVVMKEGNFDFGVLTGEVSIPKDILLAENEDGSIDSIGHAKVFVSGKINSTKNFILNAQISPSQIPGLEGFSFQLENGFYDMSETENPIGIKFPKGYGDSNTIVFRWKGTWFSNLTLKAPEGWGAAGKGERFTMAMTNFIKDKSGVSIVGEARNIIGIDKGELVGFAVSVDTIRLDIIRNQFKQITMDGKMGLPILPDKTYLYYHGIVDRTQKKDTSDSTKTAKQDPLSLRFTVVPEKDGYPIDWLYAKLEFDSTTQMVLKNDKKDKGLDILINGTLRIKDSTALTPFDLPGLRFEGMQITKYSLKDGKSVEDDPKNKGKQNTGGAFTFVAPTFSLSSSNTPSTKSDATKGTTPTKEEAKEESEPQKIQGFRVTLDSINMDVKNSASGNLEGITLAMKTTVSFVGAPKKNKKGKKESEGLSVSATGGFSITCNVKGTKPKEMTFTPETPELTELELNAAVSGMKMIGKLKFENGGATGMVNLTTPISKVEVNGRFGNESGLAYWYIFGKAGKVATVGNPYPSPYTTIGTLNIYSFNGGVYYHMRELDNSEVDPSKKFVPDASTSIGLKAGITFSVGGKEARPQDFFANTTVGFEFNNSGGINNINIEGDAYMMKSKMVENPIVNGDGSNVEGLQAHIKAKLNFQTNETPDFEADLDVYAKVSASGVDFKGVQNTKNKLIDARLSIKSDKWFLYMGRPSADGTLAGKGQFTFDALNLTLGAEAFFMMGNTTLPVPVLPADIVKYLGKQAKGLTGMAGKDQVNTRNSGGMVMGAQVRYNFHITAAILYVDFSAMFGFDLSVLDKKNVYCSNLGGKEIGIDGKYFQGKVYGGFKGDLGLDIDLFFYEGKISLVNLQAGMLLQGGLPNPIWVNGRANMRYEVLGGLITGSTGFSVSFGTVCDENKLAKFGSENFIADVTPSNSSSNVSVFAKQRVSFNSKVGPDEIYTFEVYEPVGKDPAVTHKVWREYRVLVKEAKILDQKDKVVKSSGKVIEQIEYELKSDEMLEGASKYTFSITLKAETRIKGEKEWRPHVTKDKNEWEESAAVSFTTGVPPDEITHDNIVFQYPLAAPSVYFVDNNESKQGFIILENKIDYLFKVDNQPNQPWHSKLEVWFIMTGVLADESTADIYKTPLVVNGKVITFNMPDKLPLGKKRLQMFIVRDFYANSNYDNSTVKVEDVIQNNDTLRMEGQTYKNYDVKKPNRIDLFYNEFTPSKFNSFESLMNTSTNKGRTVVFYKVAPNSSLANRWEMGSMRLYSDIDSKEFDTRRELPPIGNFQFTGTEDESMNKEYTDWSQNKSGYGYYINNFHSSYKLDEEDEFNKKLQVHYNRQTDALNILKEVLGNQGVLYEKVLNNGALITTYNPMFGEYHSPWYFENSMPVLDYNGLSSDAKRLIYQKESILGIQNAKLQQAFGLVWSNIDDKGNLLIRPSSSTIKVNFLYQVPFLPENVGEVRNRWYEKTYDFRITK